MVPILSKSAEQIGIRDIEALIESRVPEGEQIEFKGALPAKDNSSDPWMCGKRLGERAKREILQESVAFANAYGGAFVLGVEESSNKPPTATRIQPIPRCTELAECLKHMFRDCVEPQIPRIEIFGVPIEDDSGVIVVRVGRSRLAPHRVTSTLVCPVRRSDRCERMSMREIQDLTLNMSRGLERLDRVLRARAERFHEEFECLSTPKDAFGLRMTAVPIGEEIRLDPVYRGHDVVQDFVEPWHWVYRRGTDPVQRLKFSDDSNLQPNFGDQCFGLRGQNHIQTLVITTVFTAVTKSCTATD